MLSAFFDGLEVPHLILRDKAALPKRSGFDIDLLIDEGNRKDIIALCLKIAAEHGVLALHNDKRVALFYLSYEGSYRNWAILDLQSAYKFGAQNMNVHDMLDMPEGQRETLIKNVQAARKGTASKDIQQQLGITPYAKPQTQTLSYLQKIKRMILMRAFFIHMHTPSFIVISGPDGVGKTTLLRNILRLFETLPFNTANFHHTGLGKAKTKPVESKEENMSLGRRLRRRYTPKAIKVIYGSISGELRYAMRINKEVMTNFYRGTLTFSDRYIYDRTVKMHMLPDKLWITKIATRINAYLMRNPTVMIVPTDSAKAIFKRKQELQPDEIIRYYDDLTGVMKRCSVPCMHEIGVAGKSPEELAVEATQYILHSLSPLIFRSIGMYERDLKRS
ncbi:MAG: hypothetical protein COA45_03745 [Zetaproteobacteria bacterium]|nr:MAG: hypothetical protein COA45_03745 [Zetaproteobacteria bacterium]